MIIEFLISEYRPAPEGPVEVGAFIVVGTAYMWLELTLFLGFPIICVAEAIRFIRRRSQS